MRRYEEIEAAKEQFWNDHVQSETQEVGQTRRSPEIKDIQTSHDPKYINE
jgi:hypothetical protein